MKRTWIIDDTPEGNREFVEKHRAEGIRRLETDPEYVKRLRKYPDWSEIEKKLRAEGVKFAGEDASEGES